MITSEQSLSIIKDQGLTKDEVEDLIDNDDFKWEWSQKRTTFEEFLRDK